MKKSPLIGIIIVLILSFFSVSALLTPGFFPMHDNTQVARVFEMRTSLADGMFPVRWVSTLGYGYGYPIFNFYAPLAYYVGGVMDLIINDSLIATKIMIAIGILLAGIFMYLLSREFWGELGGVLSAILYVYAPYHALNVFVRGAVAETYGYAFIPLAFFGFYKSYREREWKYVVLGSLGLTGIVTSHNLTALMTLPFLVLLIGVLNFKQLRKKNLLAMRPMLFALVLGLLLSGFYWLPALSEMKYTNVSSQIGGGADYKDHFVCVGQLWDSAWSFGGSIPGCIDGLSFRVGKIHLLLTLSVFLGLLFIKKNNAQKYAALYCLAILTTSIFLMTDYSKFIWNSLSPMEYFQYPWRFLVLTSAVTSFLGGGAVWVIGNQSKFRVSQKIITASGSLIIVIVIFLYAKLFAPQVVLPLTNTQLTNTEFINWDVSKISDEYMPIDFNIPASPSDLPVEKFSIRGTNVQLIENKTQSLRARVISPVDGVVHINTAYFPAWKATVNGENAEVRKSQTGIDVAIQEGGNEISLQYIETPIEKLANLLSLSGFCMLVIGIIMSRKRTALK